MPKKRKVVNGIESSVRKGLTKFEAKELEKIIEAVEWHEYKSSGLSMISGGFATLEAYDMDEDYNEDKDKDEEVILMEMVTGEQDMGGGHSRTDKNLFHIPRSILTERTMTTEWKINQIIKGAE